VRPVLLHERAERTPVLARHDVLLGGAPLGRIAVPSPLGLDVALLAGPDGGDEERLQPLADVGIGMGHEPVRRFHHVGVGVVHDATFDVRHGGPPRGDHTPEVC